MSKKIIAFVIVVAIVQLACSVGANAQLPRSCFAQTIWFWPDALPPGYFINDPCLYGAPVCGEGPFSYWIATVWAGCKPPKKDNRDQCPYCGNPISLATGNTYIEEMDVSVPGLGGGLKLNRTWNSAWPATQVLYQTGLFGDRWKSTYEEKIFLGSDHFVKYMRGDGDFWSFGLSSSGSAFTVAAPSNVNATLLAGTTSWTLTFQNGEKRVFDINSGLLTAIVDRNGNTTQLTYDTSNRLTTVTDAAGRHLYFTYGSPTSYLVTQVSSDVGITLSYSYDTQGRLAQVTKPDLTTTNFTYNSQSLITSVTDSQGKVLESHTYDSQGRGLTSSQANGVGAVTISYQ